MKEIPIRDRHGIIAFAKVDDSDFETLNAFRWHMVKSDDRRYAQRSFRKDGKKFNVRMHREILGLVSSKEYGDHKDGDGLNNQRGNLRKARSSQNQMNCKVKEGRYKGVYAHGRKWRVLIKKDQRAMHIGTYESMEAAALAYNEAATRLFGEFARLNTIDTQK